jgi:hypothetical protein
MRELNLDHLPTDMRGLHPNSRNGKGTPKGQPKSESCREAMRKAYQKRRDSGWTQAKYQYNTPDGVMLLSKAAEHYGVSKHIIGYRAKSDNPKWKEWYRIDR